MGLGFWRMPNQRALPIEAPSRARVIVGIDPATTDGAAVALFCPPADRLAAGDLPGLLAAWIWRGSTAKAAGPAGLRLSAAACTPTGAKPIDGTPLHPAHAQIGALIAARCAAMPLVVACEKPPPMGGFARSAGQIVWISGLVCGPILARCPEAQLLRPMPMQWRAGIGLPKGEKPTAEVVGKMLHHGIPANLAAVLSPDGDAALPVDVIEACAIALWAAFTEGKPKKRTGKRKTKAI
jgi:hypothetical protein